ncbi:MAG: shikimate kinase [Phaeodactylibacter sp.]|uniref:shikimate kinase n=1 Tax=Phaeodactylibacter sp. TaxID=1940289 RepID=UPI0032EABD9C
MQIYLLGFMGSGKSYSGKRLAELLGRAFTDLDTFIEEQEGRSVRSIFEQAGEAYFRQAEAAALRQMAAQPAAVVATGGGTPCFHQNMDWMNQNGLTIYLDTAPAVLFQRLKEGRSHRPLIRSMTEEALRQFIHDKLQERSHYYQQASIVYQQRTGKEAVAEDLSYQFTNIIGH